MKYTARLAIALGALAALTDAAAAGPSKSDIIRQAHDLAESNGDNGQAPAADAEPAEDDAERTESEERTAAAAAAERVADRDAWQRILSKRIGKSPAKLINIYNTWTHEYVAFEVGYKGPVAAQLTNEFLRCHFTNHTTDMEPRLIPTLLAAANHFRSRRIDIISGFRAPKYNLILRKKGRNVARNSQHTHGRAVDFRLRGVSTARLRDWARRQKLGGVGFYPGDGFVHIDSWKIRTWTN